MSKQGTRVRKAELKGAVLTPIARTLLEMLAKLDAFSGAKVVHRIVDVAGDILDNPPPGGGSRDEEIAALLDQEEGWKEMAERSAVGLKEDVKKFFEPFGEWLSLSLPRLESVR